MLYKEFIKNFEPANEGGLLGNCSADDTQLAWYMHLSIYLRLILAAYNRGNGSLQIKRCNLVVFLYAQLLMKLLKPFEQYIY